MADKHNIRRQLLQQRRQLNPEIQQQHSASICDKIINADFYRNSQHIAAYISIGGEVDCTAIFNHIFSHDKQLYLPVLTQQMAFYTYSSGEPLSHNQLNFAEPSIMHKQPIAPEQLDLIIMPLVAFDQTFNRIGRGAGHYDRYLEFMRQTSTEKRPLLVGVAYQFQKLAKIDPDPWDIPLDHIITE